MKIGKYIVKELRTSLFALDGGAMFGIIPKSLWEKTNPSDARNRIRLGARCLLLISDEKKILVDTGLGGCWDEKFISIYDVRNNSYSILEALASEGIAPVEITDIILTHLHFDHTGGSVVFENGKTYPAFPNAIYHVQQAHYDWAMNPSDRDKASFVKSRFEPIVLEGLFKFYNGYDFFDECIAFHPINGHTFSQQAVRIFDSSNTLFYCADLIPTASHIPVPYVMGYDLQPLVTVEEKKGFLQMAVEQNWYFVFEHDPTIAAATIQLGDKGFSLKEKFEILP